MLAKRVMDDDGRMSVETGTLTVCFRQLIVRFSLCAAFITHVNEPRSRAGPARRVSCLSAAIRIQHIALFPGPLNVCPADQV